jgi:DNA-binding SARP family transcriptional activator/WD40 repeat protein/tRNA A-37 threonylcarbamoyl transferase component Bud32
VLVRALGPLDVLDGTRSVLIGGPQQRRVLAALVVGGETGLTYERLVAILWPAGEDTPAARHSAISYVARLRAVLGTDAIVTTESGYRLDTSLVDVDIARFLALTESAAGTPTPDAVAVYAAALELWRGPPFGSMRDEWWAADYAAALEQLRLDVLCDRVDALAATGRSSGVTAEAVAVASGYPESARAVEQAMRALHMTGRTREALQLSRRHRQALGEAGLVPGPSIATLEVAIATNGELAMPSDAVIPAMRGYVVHELLGEGTSAVVHRATQPELQRDVAIKQFRSDIADSSPFIRAFETEARILARLEHPRIVPLYDAWREPGRAFLVFKYMRGGTAAELLDRSPTFTTEKAWSISEHVGEALLAAHRAGVVHRDIKPANVLFDEHGEAYLADFGLAGAVDAGVVEPNVASPLPSTYASPEAAEGLQVDARSDQYSFARAMREFFARVPDRPAGVDDVLDQAMSRDPAARYGDVGQLLDELRASVHPDAAASPVHQGNPYLGLQPFTEADADVFFGRDRVLDELASMVDLHGLVVVTGASGVGKTSLLHAGLVPRLRASDALVAPLTLGADPFGDLRAALMPLARIADVGSLDTVRFASRHGVVSALRSISPHEPVVLVIDQLETLWSAAGEGPRRDALDALVAAADAGVARVVASIRADRYDLPLNDPGIGAAVAAATFALAPLDAVELHDAITRPAAMAGVVCAPALVSRLVGESLDQPGGLPLLQFVLSRLFDLRSSDAIGLGDLDRIGGFGGAVSRLADEVFDGAVDADRPAIRALFGRLVSISPDGSATSRRARRNELVAVPGWVIERFVQTRLLTLGRESGSRLETVEIGHDALLRSWPRLAAWLEDDAGWLRHRDSIVAAASIWEASARNDGDLLRGPRLAAALDLDASRLAQLTDSERTFLDASAEHALSEARAAAARLADARRHARRLRRALIAASVAIVALLAAGAIAVGQRAQADKARRSAMLSDLASTSLTLRASQRDTAALLAVEAWRYGGGGGGGGAESALFGSVSFDPTFVGFATVDGAERLRGAPLGSSGTVVVAGLASGTDDRLIVVDLGTGRTVRELTRVPGDLIGIGVSGDGTRVGVLASSDAGRTLVILDTTSGATVAGPLEVDLETTQLALDAAGQRLATVTGTDGRVTIYDAGTGRITGEIEPVEGVPASVSGWRAGAVAFTPSGLLLVGSLGTGLREFDIASAPQLVETIDVPPLATASTIVVVDGGRAVITQGADNDATDGFSQPGALARIDLELGEVDWVVDGDRYGFGECQALATDSVGDRLWCGNYFGVIRERSGATGELSGAELQNQKGLVADLALVEDTTLVAFGGNAGSIARWRVDGTGLLQRLVDDHLAFLSYAPDGNVLAARRRGSPYDEGYQLVDASTGETVRVLDEYEWASSTGSRVFGLTWSGTVRVERGDGRPISEFDAVRTDGLETAVVDPEGELVALGYDDGTTDVYDIDAGRLERRFGGNPRERPAEAFAIAVDTGRNRLYVAGFGVWAYDLGTGAVVGHRSDRSILNVGAAAGHVVVALTDGRLEVVDPDTLVTEQTLTGARGFVEQLRLSTDGRRVLAAGNDGSVALYDLSQRGRLVGDILQFGGNTGVQVDLRADGLEAMVARRSGEGFVAWDLRTEAWVSAACTIAGRDLTVDESATYLDGLGSPGTCSDQVLSVP